jgi:HAD superfamily hydrolase (TIGR01509 family)
MSVILWDLDDTVLNTLRWRMKALAYAHETLLGTKVDPEALWRSHRGGTLEDLGRRLVGDDYREFASVYRERYFGSARDIRPYAGVEPVLRSFRAAGFDMGIVTSKVAWGATEELASAAILQYFHTIVGFDDTDNHKPDPEPIYAALDRMLADDPSAAVYIGDSPADIWAARNAGIRSIAALWGTLDAGLLLDAMPDFTAESPGEVLAILSGEAFGR